MRRIANTMNVSERWATKYQVIFGRVQAEILIYQQTAN